MYDLYIKSVHELSARRHAAKASTEIDEEALAQYEKLLHQLAKTPIPREPTASSGSTEATSALETQLFDSVVRA